ncbi:MAG: class I SAM-dependent methyltransferase [Maricaulis sp.]|uniref:class I SAM-dependent methyltransferase n=1 Tax=Maricaulis sp. TaxID=1486257 RepID=UPI001AFE13FC|nr:class I SAM-dependent methyltransferase [Maricaulis sp.]MBO6731000.1 class I SAM-dependent methyltransferase [Maricaulis sp.]MBO6848829.1 class I SAM-dependent methyltransferase [Maricaulis sp.]MBO6878911.1 class I SAM-dependent methyltransferase [Maricaulis sp.]
MGETVSHPALYDTIGLDYAQLRKPDPRIEAAIHAALGEARTVLNVGAGAGSYEPSDRPVTALEPSSEMIAQRPAGSAEVVQGVAEDLPFGDKSFDAVMAVLTVHHWRDRAKGLAELRRVSRGPVVILTFDVARTDFWLADYIPELVSLDEDEMPDMSLYGEVLGPVDIHPVEIPGDCVDGFLCAYWKRPAAYLDERVRGGISSFWKIGDITPALTRLASDLESGAWEKRYGGLLALDGLDCGYRLVVTRDR